MSLKVLRETLFNFLETRVGSFIGAQELEIGHEPSDTINYIYGNESFYINRTPSFEAVGSQVFSNELKHDENVTNVLGGKRGDECGYNQVGPCTRIDHLGKTRRIAPAFNFDLKGEDPTFLGGWLSDDSPFGKHYSSIIADRDNFKLEIAELEKAQQILQNEKNELQVALKDAQDPSNYVEVFPFVDWSKANSSKSWYNDINWSKIPFVHLSEDEKTNLDWSKIDYTEAIKSETFTYDLIDWKSFSTAPKKILKKTYASINWGNFDFSKLEWPKYESIDWSIVDFAEAQSSDSFELSFDQWWWINNELNAKSKKKVYNKIDWGKIKYSENSADKNSYFDWAHVNIKEALASSDFTLDAVDIYEAKNSKNFKKLSAALKKSSSDALIKDASANTLRQIGYQNFTSKINDRLLKEISTNFGDYVLVMKPYKHEFADLVAKGMGGKLATLNNKNDEFFDKLTGVFAGESVSKMLQKSADVTGTWKVWLDETLGEESLAIFGGRLDPGDIFNNPNGGTGADPVVNSRSTTYTFSEDEHFFLVEMVPCDFDLFC